MRDDKKKLKIYDKKARIKSLIFLAFFSLLLCGLVLALQGSGTVADPYQIHNWTELNSIRNDLSANYKLVANLSSSDSDYSTFNSGSGWNPIGNDTNPFTGTFNGNGNTISYLYIYRPFTNYIGLFGYTSSSSSIYNVSLVQSDINGYWSAGGIVGWNEGNISSSYSTGKIQGTFTIGGLVGQNYGTINNTYSTVNATGSAYFGGLVGYNDGDILNSYSIGFVSATEGSSYAGGLIGSKGASSVITNAYYNNETSTQNDASSWGTAKNTSQMNTVPYDAYAGWDFTNVWVNTSNVVYDYNENVGYPALNFQSSTDTIPPYSSGASVNNTKVSLPTLFSIYVKDNLPLNPNGYFIFSTNNSGSWVNDSVVNFTSVTQTVNVTKTLSATPKVIGYKWYIFDGSGNMIVYSSSITSYSIQGSGTEDDPYLITTWADLHGIRNSLSSYYKLANDLSSSTSDYSTYNSGQGFVPIGAFATPFTGTLDGDGHIISDLLMYNNSRGYVGLFNYPNGATVANLGLVNVNISGQNNVGAFFTRMGGTTNIYNSYVTGTINSTDYVGGICGHCQSLTIRNCYANVNITGRDTVGGIGGYLGTALYNSYSTGHITANSYIGGLFGSTDATILNSYSNMNITNSSSTGVRGLVGSAGANGAIIISGLWDINSSGMSLGYGTNPDGGRTTTQMKTLSTYFFLASRTNITNGYFETGDLTGWDTGGNLTWTINNTAFEGSYSASSGDTGDSESTWINQSVIVGSNSYLNFWWLVSSEGGGYDNLVFCLDNPACTKSSDFTNRIYGTLNPYWELVSTYLPAGTYSIHWLYGKDSSDYGGLDTGWIDNIYLTSTSIAGLDQEWDFNNIWDLDGSTNGGYPFINFTGINVTLVSPVDSSAVSSFPQTFNCSVTSLYTPKNVTFMVWASNGSLLYSNKTAVNVSLNYSIFDYTFPEDDAYKWNCEFSDIYYNKATKSTNNTLYVSTVSPAINIIYPSNNKYLNFKTNVNFNFSFYDSDNLSVCDVWGNFTGTWAKNYTFSSPSNGVENSLKLNLSDNSYLWGIFCNDTYGNGKTTYNSTVTIDTIDPNSTINSISTTNNSQTFSFNSSASDTNLGSCKYSIYNSTGSIDGLNINASITCNSNPHSATVTGYANFTLRVYATDLAGNEDYYDLNFTTSQVNGTTIIIGGGGGSQQEVEKIPTIAIIAIDNSGKYSDLQRAMLFSRINSLCAETQTGEKTLTVVDYSSGECSLKKTDLEGIIPDLALEGLSIGITDLISYYYNFNDGELEQVYFTLDDIKKYNLFTAVLGITNPMLVNPPRLDRLFIISHAEGNATIEYTFTVNKDVRECSIISGEGFSCELLTNSSVKMILQINDTNFFDKIFQGEMSITSQADPKNLEVKRISLIPRVYNISYPIAGIPALWILIFFGVVLLVLSIFWITRTRLQKELKRRMK
jgi:hypothetical protein